MSRAAPRPPGIGTQPLQGHVPRMARQRGRRLAGLEYKDFRRKLGEYLARRGFDYDTIQPVVEQAWKERAENPSGK